MTNNQSRGIAIDNSIITNHSDQCLERLAQLIHIPSVALQPYKMNVSLDNITKDKSFTILLTN